jgi:hypothetical protein
MEKIIGTEPTFRKEEVNMRNAMVWTVVIGIMLAFSGVVSAQQTLIDSVVKGCDKELKTYCKDVTPGEGRGLACLYAFSDKLTPQCEYALYDAAVQLERVINALAYTVNECRADLTAFCSNISPGEGRLIQCIEKNDAKVTKRCKQAMKDIGLKK